MRVALGGSRAWNHTEFVGESEAFAPFCETFGLIKTPAVELFVFIPRPSSSVHLLVSAVGFVCLSDRSRSQGQLTHRSRAQPCYQ